MIGSLIGVETLKLSKRSRRVLLSLFVLLAATYSMAQLPVSTPVDVLARAWFWSALVISGVVLILIRLFKEIFPGLKNEQEKNNKWSSALFVGALAVTLLLFILGAKSLAYLLIMITMLALAAEKVYPGIRAIWFRWRDHQTFK